MFRMRNKEDETPTLSQVERVMLLNQYLILAKLYPEQAEYYKDCAEVLRKGYVPEYQSKVLGSVYEKQLSEEQCKFVWDVLDMHRALLRAYEALPDKSGIDESKLRFRGFDANNDDEWGYVEYMKKEGTRWKESLEKGPTNSHSITTKGSYERMLSRWLSFDQERRWNLKKEDIQKILA